MYAIIGGTGVDFQYQTLRTELVTTPYGKVSLDIVSIHDLEVAMLSRHGKGHSIPPHLINYRANMFALKELGCTHVFATVTVGSINLAYRPGDIVVVSDFIDQTKNRISTYYGSESNRVAHVDMGDPYCKNLREKFMKRANIEGIKIAGSGVYVCAEGPRFETKSEIKMYQLFGGDLVGMTNVPEVNLAKELGMCYLAIGLVSNMGAGIVDENLAKHDFSELIRTAKVNTVRLFESMIQEELNQENCHCDDSLLIL